jgi:flagellar biosynthesis protein FlhF
VQPHEHQTLYAPTAREALAKARMVFGDGTLILPTAHAGRRGSHGHGRRGLGKLDQGNRTGNRLQAASQARDAEETRPPKALQASASNPWRKTPSS